MKLLHAIYEFFVLNCIFSHSWSDWIPHPATDRVQSYGARVQETRVCLACGKFQQGSYLDWIKYEDAKEMHDALLARYDEDGDIELDTVTLYPGDSHTDTTRVSLVNHMRIPVKVKVFRKV